MPENNTALCSTFKWSGQNKTMGQEKKTNHLLECVCVEKKVLVSLLSRPNSFMYLKKSYLLPNNNNKKMFLNQGRLLFGTGIVK